MMDYYNRDLNEDMPDDRLDKRTKRRAGLIEMFRIAVLSPKRITDLIDVKRSSFLKYVFILCLFEAILTSLIPTLACIVRFGGFNTLFMEKMPAFKIENGVLTADNKFDMYLNDYHIYMDATHSEVQFDDLPGSGTYVTFGAKEADVIGYDKTLNFMKRVLLFKYDEFAMGTVDNRTFAEGSNIFYVTIAISLVLYTLFVMLKYLLFAAILTLICWGAYRKFDINIYESEAIKLSFFGMTIAVLLSNINAVLKNLIPSFFMFFLMLFLTIRIIKTALKDPTYDEGE